MKLKVVFLSLLLASAFKLSAQTFSDGDTGFALDYSTNCLSSLNNSGFAFIGGNVSSTPTYESSTGLIKILTSNPAGPTNAGFFDLYYVTGTGPSASCTSMENGSNTVSVNLMLNSKVVIYAKASVPTDVNVCLAYTSNYIYPTAINNSLDNVPLKTISLTTDMEAYELDFSDWTGRGQVNLIGFVFRTPNSTVYIDRIIFGDAVDPEIYNNHIKGSVYNDLNTDCLVDGSDTPMQNVLLKAVGDNGRVYYGSVKVDGTYDISVNPGTVNYNISQLFNSKKAQIITNTCTPSYTVNATGSETDYCCSDFLNSIRYCSLLNVEISSDRRRRCFRNNTTVTYSNEGTQSELGVIVKVLYPEYVVPISSVPAWDDRIGDTLFYNVGTLAADESHRIQLIDSVVCDMEEIRGLTQCTKAFITPYSSCSVEDPLWDKSSIVVEGSCKEGQAEFIISNKGMGDMLAESEYRLYLNEVLIFTSSFQLTRGEETALHYESQGATMRLEADQVPLHPGDSKPRAFVEGCRTSVDQPIVLGHVMSVPQDDLDEEVACSCMPIIDSFDPNDKQVLPVGITEDQLISAGQKLQYTIRFQNTGSDLAYDIRVIDTLDTDLDITTFTQGSSSHNYSMEISGRDTAIVTYYFKNINLPDKTSNEPGSHGFVSFYINTKDDLVDGAEIKNDAGIYFDYNSPIITNTVIQAIGTYDVSDLSKGNAVQLGRVVLSNTASLESKGVKLYPNPATGMVHFDLGDLNSAEIIFFDLSGQERLQSTVMGKYTELSIGSLSTGMYTYKIHSEGDWIGVGKLIVR